MKNYMLAEGQAEGEPEDKRRSAAILRDSSVVKNYKKAMKQKKSLRKKTSPQFGPASLAGVLVMVLVLFYGVRSVQQFRQAENAEAVFRQQTVESQTTAKQGTTKRQSTAEPEDQTEKAARPDTADDTTENVSDISGAADNTTENVSDFSGTADNTTENVRDFSDTTDSTTENVRNRSAGSSGSAYDDADNDLETGADIFTQEEPDDVTESWSYIGNQYTVQRGDTLAGISMKIYQSYDYIDALAQANQIDNLDEIYPGQVLTIPPMEE